MNSVETLRLVGQTLKMHNAMRAIVDANEDLLKSLSPAHRAALESSPDPLLRAINRAKSLMTETTAGFDAYWQKFDPEDTEAAHTKAIALDAWRACEKQTIKRCIQEIMRIDDGEAPEFKACQEALEKLENDPVQIQCK